MLLITWCIARGVGSGFQHQNLQSSMAQTLGNQAPATPAPTMTTS